MLDYGIFLRRALGCQNSDLLKMAFFRPNMANIPMATNKQANYEEPDKMMLKTTFHQGSALFAKIKIMFRDRNILKLINFDL